MSQDVGQDHLVVIRVKGMHCHKCEQAVQKALSVFPGVHEVEVDLPSGQASVLYTQGSVTIAQLMEAITQAGYRAEGFTQRQVD